MNIATGSSHKKQSTRCGTVQTRPWVIMEVCGGQTHSIVKHGIDLLLPEGMELVHGPGCPVCVTPLEMIDKAHAIARRQDVIFCSFGDMLRVPGSDGDLFTIKSQGGDVRVVYSPLDCLKIARANPDKQVVFFAIGFETTAPANAMLAWRAREDRYQNSRCWFRMCWFRRPSHSFWIHLKIAYRDSLAQAMCARSSATATTSRSPSATMSQLSLPVSSPLTFCREH